MVKLFLPENGFKVFAFAIATAYGIIPIIITINLPNSGYFTLLSALTALSILAMWVGKNTPLLDKYFLSNSNKIWIGESYFILSVWICFAAFVLVTITTATSIPIISALLGAESAEISQQRGDFLKGREGAGLILVYLSTFMNTFVPYTIIMLYRKKSTYRHIALLAFVLYAISFMAKALFLFVALPLLVYASANNSLNYKNFIYIILSSILALIGLTYISLDGEAIEISEGGFFSAVYVPRDPITYFVWRSIAVPIFTAADTLLVHEEQFGGQPLMGATSSLIAELKGAERINLERFVFEHQFGSWNEIANSNAVFITDAYVNFGVYGVIFFSIVVGQIFRWFRISNDVAFSTQWINFAFTLFSASLIGAMFSNAWILMFILALAFRLKARSVRRTTKSL